MYWTRPRYRQCMWTTYITRIWWLCSLLGIKTMGMYRMSRSYVIDLFAKQFFNTVLPQIHCYTVLEPGAIMLSFLFCRKKLFSCDTWMSWVLFASCWLPLNWFISHSKESWEKDENTDQGKDYAFSVLNVISARHFLLAHNPCLVRDNVHCAIRVFLFSISF